MSASIRIEVRAKTVDEAVRLALGATEPLSARKLNRGAARATGGIFGFGAEEAVVRVTAAARADDAADDDDEYEDDDKRSTKTTRRTM